MKEMMKSRKFFMGMICYFAACLAMGCNFITDSPRELSHFYGFLAVLFGGYCAGNVGTKFANKDKGENE